MFRLDMLPAAHGDCLWLEYGDPNEPSRVLIDAGPPFTSNYRVLIDRIQALPPEHRVFELFVVTHVDADHIGGAIRLMRDAQALGVRFNRVWFNGYEQLRAHPTVRDLLGEAQGEYLTLLIEDYEARTATKVLNRDVVTDWVGLAADESTQRVTLPGDLDLTILSPGTDQLISLALEWSKVVKELGFRSEAGPLATIRDQLEASTQLRPLLAARDGLETLGDEDGDEAPDIPAHYGLEDLGSERVLGSDSSVANGSSIALLAEHPDGSALLAGDAFAPVLEASLRRILGHRGGDRVRVGAFKLPHHASAANVSDELLGLLSTKHYLVSTSGAQFGHPQSEAIHAVLDNHDGARGKPEFWFNHNSETTRPWQDKHTQAELGCVSHYPQGGTTWRP